MCEVFVPISESDREWLREYLREVCVIHDTVTEYRVLYTPGVGTEIELYGCVDAESFYVSDIDGVEYWSRYLREKGFPRYMYE